MTSHCLDSVIFKFKVESLGHSEDVAISRRYKEAVGGYLLCELMCHATLAPALYAIQLLLASTFLWRLDSPASPSGAYSRNGCVKDPRNNVTVPHVLNGPMTPGTSTFAPKQIDESEKCMVQPDLQPLYLDPGNGFATRSKLTEEFRRRPERTDHVSILFIYDTTSCNSPM
ncbi:hypothetical protein MMC07_001543 [Pseudocyphellaria aurata]|nr:hypothetical protein [Pseudocyphellaria aurata]